MISPDACEVKNNLVASILPALVVIALITLAKSLIPESPIFAPVGLVGR